MYFLTESRSTVILSRIIPGGLRSKLDLQLDCGICSEIVEGGKSTSRQCGGSQRVEDSPVLFMDFVTLFGFAM